MKKEPLFDWLRERGAGVLMHPTSLPGRYLIGGFGKEAYQFVDLIASCNFKYWQVLPLGPTGFGDSPYQSYSSYALNPYLISWDEMLENGWITERELLPLMTRHPSARVDFEELKRHHHFLIQLSVRNAIESSSFEAEFAQFKKENREWLPDYSHFMALKEKFPDKTWNKWSKVYRDYKTSSTALLDVEFDKRKDELEFEQFMLYRQWLRLKEYANERGIQIIGDIPIYVAPDSVDVWSNREQFQLTTTGKASRLAGVPPDYFNEDGQFWGNPLYNWKHHEETGFSWWINRLKHMLKLCDIIRIDHFRGLEKYWSIPAKAPSAKEGAWKKGPALSFFEAVKKKLPEAKMILEDLGEITPEVIRLKDETGCPGLAVLQFAFSGDSSNLYLPHNISADTVIYTGTHDNDTSLGWYHSATEHEKDHLRKYLQVSGDEVGWDLIRAAYHSNARICIIPLQDLLSLGNEARMNVPGVANGNWSWRVTEQQLHNFGVNSAAYLRELSGIYGRS
ncbi:MAG: 4-alpha-glucanotransferase [Opitutales bacterium]|nr:4-alpha-glucanotransferase [Opitutales bacterium]